MLDFKIRRGLSDTMFISPGVINPRFIIEPGCWYLCTDTAELFLGVLNKNSTLALKRINEVKAEIADEELQAALGALRSELRELEETELYCKIENEYELPTDFDSDSFNPNITYYIPLTEGRVRTYIFDKGTRGYLCTNSVDELVVRAMVAEVLVPTLDAILDTRIPLAIKQSMEHTVLHGGTASVDKL